MDFVEQNLQQRHKEYSEMAAYKQDLTRTFYDQVERMHVLNKAREFFQVEHEAAADAAATDALARDKPLLHDDDLEIRKRPRCFVMLALCCVGIAGPKPRCVPALPSTP